MVNVDRLTTDTPKGNWDGLMNFVHGKDNWAYIYDEEGQEVNLIDWTLKQCRERGCDDFPEMSREALDEELASCSFDFPDCPVAMAYCFASQAVHLRSRLKQYEDILFGADGKELVTLEDLRRLVGPSTPPPDPPLTLEELREMEGEPVWVVLAYEPNGRWGIVDNDRHGVYHHVNTCAYGFEVYGRIWLAYRRKPEGSKNDDKTN